MPGASRPAFAHPAERELAGLFDAHGIRWEYEPRLFVLEADARGRVREAVAPDFYLPDVDVYVECTVMRQSETTRKNRKLRKLAHRHGVTVTILYARDFRRLRDEYGLAIAAVSSPSGGYQPVMGRQMEGDDRERRAKARRARADGRRPSEDGATAGASKQRRHLERDDGHEEKVEAIRRGKHDVISENTPEVRPRSRGGGVYES